MMKWALLTLSFMIISRPSLANITNYGLQCSGIESADLKNCLKKEAGKIDEANLPNEIILSADSSGKESLLRLIKEFTNQKNSELSEKLKSLIPLVESSVATALIIQYEDEPQLYYYAVDKNGKLEVIFDGLNSVDIEMIFSSIFKNERDIFYLKSSNVSKTFIEWLNFLNE